MKKMNDCYPSGFDFFNIGNLKPLPNAKTGNDFGAPELIVMFRVIGLTPGNCLIGFSADQGRIQKEAESMLIEMANILASKFAMIASEFSKDFIEISPPEVLKRTSSTYNSLIELVDNIKTYEYLEDKINKYQVKMAFIPMKAANA